MRTRLMVGTTLALLMVGLLLLDGHLATSSVAAPREALQAAGLGHWLQNGAICTAIIMALTLLTTRELVQFARGRGYEPLGVTASLFSIILVLAPYVSYNLSPLTGGYDESWGLLWMAVALTGLFIYQAAVRRTQNAMENIAFTMFIVFYAGGLASFMTKLRMEVGGRTGVAVLMFSVLLVKLTDTGAYFIGSLIGRHKMIPWLSPKKTWEGFAGGMATTILCAVLLGHWLHVAGLVHIRDAYLPHPWPLVILGVLLGLFSVAGDLCASLLKRDAEVKDSGRALPGLGGVLDVVDSPLLAAPAAWFFWTRMFHLG